MLQMQRYRLQRSHQQLRSLLLDLKKLDRLRLVVIYNQSQKSLRILHLMLGQYSEYNQIHLKIGSIGILRYHE